MRLLLALALAAPCRAFWWFGHRSQSRWMARPVHVDGSRDDWPQNDDEADGLAYAFANDGRDLCLMLSPHTKETRAQMAGLQGQSFTLWLDPKGGSRRALGLRLAPPAGGDPDLPRRAEAVGLDVKSISPGDADLRMGPVLQERGAFEACVPLSWLGPVPPEKVGVGFTVSRAAGYRRPERRPSDLDDALDPLFLWVQVKLAPPPRP